MTEAQAVIGMVQYYRSMWPMRSQMIAPLKEVASGPKDETKLNNTPEYSFKELKLMFSNETF